MALIREECDDRGRHRYDTASLAKWSLTLQRIVACPYSEVKNFFLFFGLKMKAPHHISLSGATGPATVAYSVEQGAF